MTQLNRALVRRDVKWGLLGYHLTFIRRFILFLRDHIIACSYKGNTSRYHRLQRTAASVKAIPSLPMPASSGEERLDVDPNLVSVKISLLGDCGIGKTSFMIKYVGDTEGQKGLQMTGLNLMDKMFSVRGARILHSIWDVGGDRQFLYHLPIACKDSAAILYMFDLTNRCTLNNVIGWYRQARRWNKFAIPILIGTKFDSFVKLPVDIQWTVVNQTTKTFGQRWSFMTERMIFWERSWVRISTTRMIWG